MPLFPVSVGSTALVSTSPKFWVAQGPHSPLVALFIRSQSGTKLPLRSVHDRVVDGAVLAPPPPINATGAVDA